MDIVTQNVLKLTTATVTLDFSLQKEYNSMRNTIATQKYLYKVKILSSRTAYKAAASLS